MDEKKQVILRLANISQSYVVKDDVKPAVDDVSLEVYKNEFLVVLGPGHCGKTVLMNIIAGIENPVDGKLYLEGKEIHGSNKKIGMVFQTMNLMPWRTVMGNVEFGLEIAGVVAVTDGTSAAYTGYRNDVVMEAAMPMMATAKGMDSSEYYLGDLSVSDSVSVVFSLK